MKKILSIILARRGSKEIKDKNHNKKFVKKYLDKVPLKRFCRPSDIAANVLFLSSNASSYITGTMIVIDGGWTAI